MEPASSTTWLQPLQLRTQNIQSVWKYQVLFRILQTFKNLNLLFIGQMIKSQSEKCLAQNEPNIYVGVHVGSGLIKVKDTHLMNNNQPVAEILCWRLEYVSSPLSWFPPLCLPYTPLHYAIADGETVQSWPIYDIKRRKQYMVSKYLWMSKCQPLRTTSYSWSWSWSKSPDSDESKQ